MSWDESKHPRVPAGSSQGGQFTSGRGGGSEALTVLAAREGAGVDRFSLSVSDWSSKTTQEKIDLLYDAIDEKLQEITDESEADWWDEDYSQDWIEDELPDLIASESGLTPIILQLKNAKTEADVEAILQLLADWEL